MKRVSTLTLRTLGLLLLGMVLSAGAVCAQTTKDLAGTWTLVSTVTEQGGHKTSLLDLEVQRGQAACLVLAERQSR